MNAAPIPPRDVKPADRPLPRDPQAAGASDGDPASAETRFTDLVKEAASDPTAMAKPQDPVSDAEGAKKNADAPSEKGEATTPTDTKTETPVAMPTPPIALAQPARPTPPAPTADTEKPGAVTDKEASGQGQGRIAALKSAALSSPQPDTPATKKTREPQAASDKFDALFGVSQTHSEAPPPAPATPAAAGLGRPAEPPAPVAAPPPLQPSLPIAALPASIAIKALSGSNRIDIRLDPEELGRIDVALEIDRDGHIRASIAAEKPEALQLIVREARALEQAFDQAGFRRDENTLNFSLSDRQSSPQDQQNSQNRPQTTRFFVDGDGELPPSLAALVNTTTNRADGRLDVRI